MAEILDPSERLALQLMRQDLEELKAERKGKERAGELDDFELALQMQVLHITDHVRSLEDLEYCLRHYPQPNAEPRAGPASRRARPPTSAAAGPSGQTRTSAPAATASAATAPSVTDKLGREQPESGESSTPGIAGISAPTDEGDGFKCAACNEVQDKKLAARVPCGHVYCPDCLASLFGAATTDESLFPPRCCKQPIQLDATKKWLPEDLIREVERKQLEFTTPNRTYCSNMLCSSFIPPDKISSNRGRCPECLEWTCTSCKSAVHDGFCPEDPSKNEILVIAKENGWQQCHGCKRLVELNTGCNHMRCLCGSEFCYKCGKKWQTCSCELWSEARLVQRAEQLVNRGMFGGQRNRDAVRQAQQHIRRSHECDHRGWNFRSGGGRCEECRQYLPSFLFECIGCNIMACQRCKLNRL